MTMSAAIGSAEEAVRQGAFKLADGQTFEQVSGMIALSYGLTYIWGTVGIILICKYLPRWWGVDAKAAAKKYEEEKGVPNVDDAGLTGYRPLALRAYRLTNAAVVGKTVRQFLQKYPQYKVVNVGRGDERLGAADDLVFQKGDVIALGGRLEAMTENMGLIGPEVPDSKVLNIPARPGRDPGHQQGDGRQGAPGISHRGVRRADRAAPHRARRRDDPDRPQHQARAFRRAVRRGLEVRRWTKSRR